MTQLVDGEGLDLRENQGEEIETGDNNGEQGSEGLIITDDSGAEEELYTLGDGTEGYQILEISFDLPCVIL